jgi:hypothetical protein
LFLAIGTAVITAAVHLMAAQAPARDPRGDRGGRCAAAILWALTVVAAAALVIRVPASALFVLHQRADREG